MSLDIRHNRVYNKLSKQASNERQTAMNVEVNSDGWLKLGEYSKERMELLTKLVCYMGGEKSRIGRVLYYRGLNYKYNTKCGTLETYYRKLLDRVNWKVNSNGTQD